MAFRDYTQLFSGAEQKYGLRPGTGSALMSLEDASGNPYAKSPAGAMGPLQLMPGTASEMGVKNPFDPAANIDGGLHYFSNILNNQAHGDYRTAAMGYNAGPNRSSFPSSSQGYADQFMSRMGDPTQQPQPGGQPPMPPRTPPMSLGAMMGQQAPVNMGGPPPVNTDVMGTSSLVPQGNSLGSMAQGMPQMPTKAPSKFTAGNILGTLGDALSAYGGRAPTFGPFLREQAMMDKQQGFEREKFNQELQMRMYAMMHPEDMLKADIFNALPAPQQRSQLRYLDAVHPEYSMTAQGQVLNHRVTDPPPDAIARLQQDVGRGDHTAVVEFDQMFGPGASAEALGGR